MQYKSRHKGCEGLKSSMCRVLCEHNAQWALAWMCTEYYPISTAAVKIIAEPEWTSCRVIELLHNGTALRCAPKCSG